MCIRETAYHIISPVSLWVKLADLHPGLGHWSKVPSPYLPTIIAILIPNPGVKTSFSDGETTCEESSVLYSSYSPVETFLCPSPVLKWAKIMASSF